MATKTGETMTKMFDSFSDAWRSAFEAGRRTQEAWSRTMTNPFGKDGGFEDGVASPEQFTKAWMPFMAGNMNAFAECCGTGFRSGMSLFKTACDVTFNTRERDPYKDARRVWDAAFDASRTGLDAIGDAGKEMAEQGSKFARNAFSEEVACKTTTKAPAK